MTTGARALTLLELKPRYEQFAQFYLQHGNVARAAVQAGVTRKYAKRAGTAMLARPDIRWRIDEIRAQQYARLRITPDQTLARIAAIAHANPDDLISHRMVACRYCHGREHRYQYTEREYERKLEDHQLACERAVAMKIEQPREVDIAGGLGYTRRRDPHPDCPECFGEGETYVRIADTSKLSAEARSLLAGVKVTKDGLEVKMHDQLGALRLLLQHQGLLVERTKTEVTGAVTVQHEYSPREIARRIAFALTLGLAAPEPAVGVTVEADTGSTGG